MPDDTILDLLERWEAGRRGGREPTPTELCPSDPVLREELRRRIDRRGALGPLLTPGGGAAPGDADAPPWGVPGYAVEREIGRGGMGVVYLAHQLRPSRAVALKVLPAARNTPALRLRFEHETAALGRLSHPGIAQIFQAGVAETPGGALPYFAMELVDGRPITAHADEHRLGTRERVGLVAQLCDAVQHAHQQGVVHRDLKPANVLVGADGRVKVLDFGVAKLVEGDTREPTGDDTRDGDVVGTVGYMSPEQAAGDAEGVDTRSDVYAVGVILYELLAGRRPLDLAGRRWREQLDAVINDDPPRLGGLNRACRGDLETIAAKAMEKDKARRYPSVSELAADLRRYLADEPVLARPPGAWYLLGKFARKRRPLVAGGALAALAVVTAAAVSGAFWLKEREQRRLKEAAEQDALNRLIEIALQRGRWADVLAGTDLALAAGHPDTARLRLNRVRALHALADPRASAVVEEIAARPDLTGAERAEVELWRGDILLLRNETGEGRDSLRRAVDGGLTGADREYALGVLAESAADADHHLRTALEADPFHHSARAYLAYLLVFSGSSDEFGRILAVGEVAFPDDPTFVILRLINDVLRGNNAAVPAALGRLRAVLGDEAAEDLRLVADTLQSLFVAHDEDGGVQLRKAFQFNTHLREAMARVSGRAADRRPVLIVFPPVFEKSYRLLQQAQARAKQRAFADELGAVARAWPDAVLYKAWGDALLIQQRYEQAAEAFEAGMAARTAFRPVAEGMLVSHLLTVATMFQMADGPTRERLRPKIADDVRRLLELYRGAGAVGFTRNVIRGQVLGHAAADICWQAGEFDLARAVLREWEKVDPKNPNLHAERAHAEYFNAGYGYGQAIEAVKKAREYDLKDPLLTGNVNFIFKDAPKKIRELAEKYPVPPDEKKGP